MQEAELKVTKIDSANAKARAKIPAKTLQDTLDKIAKKTSKNLKLDGFRKGHIPLNVVKSRYGAQLKQDSQRECVQDLLKNILKELNVSSDQIIGEPRILKFDESNNGIDIEVELSLIPEIKLGDIDQCIPSFTLPKVSDKDVQKRLEDIAKSRAPLVSIKDKTRGLENGDFAKIDFEGFVDNTPFDGGKAENYTLEIGSKSFIPGFEDQLIGLKIGEERDINVTFPQNYQAQHLAGKEAVFKVKLHDIEVKGEQPIDDSLTKEVFPNEENVDLNTLKERVKEQLINEEKQKLYNEELKAKLIDALDSSINFDLPQTIIEQEMDLLLRNNFVNLSKEEQKALSGDAEAVKKKREEFRNDAQKSVKVTFIIDAIAKEKGIGVDDKEVLNTIFYEAMTLGQNPRAMLEHYKNNNLLPAVKMAMLEDRVLTNLLDSKSEEK